MESFSHFRFCKRIQLLAWIKMCYICTIFVEATQTPKKVIYLREIDG